MKKLVLVLAIVFAGIMSANAQVWIGGGVGAKVDNGGTLVKLAPELGYSINNQWQVALGTDYTLAAAGGATAHALNLEPYVRYVGGTIDHKFFVFVDLCGEIGLLNNTGFAVLLKPGVAWQVTEKFTAAFRLGYLGYDHGFVIDPQFASPNGFVMNCDLAAPQIRLYYSF